MTISSKLEYLGCPPFAVIALRAPSEIFNISKIIHNLIIVLMMMMMMMVMMVVVRMMIKPTCYIVDSQVWPLQWVVLGHQRFWAPFISVIKKKNDPYDIYIHIFFFLVICFMNEMMLVQSEHKTQIKLKYGHNTWIGASPLLLIHVFIYRPDWL